MKQYLYPKNLKAVTSMWLWSLRDFAVLGISALLSIITLVHLQWMLPTALTLCYGFLTIRTEDSTILDHIRNAVRFFLTTQQYYEWR